MFEIDKDIEIPSRCRGKRGPTYPWNELGVGDSFFAPSDARCFTAAAHRARFHGGKYTTRAVEENGVVGFRVWRVE